MFEFVYVFLLALTNKDEAIDSWIGLDIVGTWDKVGY